MKMLHNDLWVYRFTVAVDEGHYVNNSERSWDNHYGLRKIFAEIVRKPIEMTVTEDEYCKIRDSAARDGFILGVVSKERRGFNG